MKGDGERGESFRLAAEIIVDDKNMYVTTDMGKSRRQRREYRSHTDCSNILRTSVNILADLNKCINMHSMREKKNSTHTHTHSHT